MGNYIYLPFIILTFFLGPVFFPPSALADSQKIFIIEDFHSQKVLWEAPVQEHEEFLYQYIHSVYRVNVYHKYKIDPSDGFILISVISSPLVLFSPYPGYQLPIPSDSNDSEGMKEIKIMRKFPDLVIAVGDEITNKSIWKGEKLLILRKIAGEGKTVRIHVRNVSP